MSAGQRQRKGRAQGCHPHRDADTSVFTASQLVCSNCSRSFRKRHEIGRLKSETTCAHGCAQTNLARAACT